MPSHLAEISIFGGAEATISERDVEKTADQIFEHGSIRRKQTPDLTGIAFEPGGASAGKVKDQPNMLFFARGDLKHFAKSGEFVAANRTVGPSHLGPERDHCNRERDPPTGVVTAAIAVSVVAAVRKMADNPLEQLAHRPAQRQIVGNGNDPADQAHRDLKWGGERIRHRLANSSFNRNLLFYAADVNIRGSKSQSDPRED
jgi:hypothetical protein